MRYSRNFVRSPAIVNALDSIIIKYIGVQKTRKVDKNGGLSSGHWIVCSADDTILPKV